MFCDILGLCFALICNLCLQYWLNLVTCPVCLCSSIRRLKTSLHDYSNDGVFPVGLCSIYYVDEQRYVSLKLLSGREGLTAQGLESLPFSLCSIRNASELHVELHVHFWIFPFKTDVGNLETNQWRPKNSWKS